MKTFLFSIVIASFAIVGCTADDKKDCKFCFSQVTDSETGSVTRKTEGEGEFCDAALELKENEEPIEFDGAKSEWICE